MHAFCVASLQTLLIQCPSFYFTEENSALDSSENNPPKDDSFSSASGEKVQSPLTQRYQTCKANLQSTSKMSLSSELVYSKELSLPDGVEVISVKPSAGNNLVNV